MKLKLDHSEFTSMLQMFATIVIGQETDNPAGKLHKALMMQIYEKLYKSGVRPKASYSIGLTDAEAIAFWFFWQKHEFKNPASYEANLVRTTNNLIHQKLIV